MLMIRARREWMERLGSLLEDYKREKISFKEESFTLFDFANYIYTKITHKNDNNKLFYLMNKYKNLKNKERGFPKTNELNAKELFDMKELDLTFENIMDKSTYETQIITSFIDELENYE